MKKGKSFSTTDDITETPEQIRKRAQLNLIRINQTEQQQLRYCNELESQNLRLRNTLQLTQNTNSSRITNTKTNNTSPPFILEHKEDVNSDTSSTDSLIRQVRNSTNNTSVPISSAWRNHPINKNYKNGLAHITTQSVPTHQSTSNETLHPTRRRSTSDINSAPSNTLEQQQVDNFSPALQTQSLLPEINIYTQNNSAEQDELLTRDNNQLNEIPSLDNFFKIAHARQQKATNAGEINRATAELVQKISAHRNLLIPLKRKIDPATKDKLEFMEGNNQTPIVSCEMAGNQLKVSATNFSGVITIPRMKNGNAIGKQFDVIRYENGEVIDVIMAKPVLIGNVEQDISKENCCVYDIANEFFKKKGHDLGRPPQSDIFKFANPAPRIDNSSFTDTDDEHEAPNSPNSSYTRRCPRLRTSHQQITSTSR